MAYSINDEFASQSPCSPGVVQNIEELLRIIFSPEHINDSGDVLPAAIALEDLRIRGFSVYRRAYTRQVSIQETINAQRDRNPEQREIDFIAKLLCEAVRQMEDDSAERAFIVLDTAHESNPAHASIYSAKTYPQKSPFLRKLRGRLLPLLARRCSLESLFSQLPCG